MEQVGASARPPEERSGQNVVSNDGGCRIFLKYGFRFIERLGRVVDRRHRNRNGSGQLCIAHR